MNIRILPVRSMPSAKELQKRIEDARSALAEIKGKAPTYEAIAAATIAFRQAEIAVAASQLAELSTRTPCMAHLGTCHSHVCSRGIHGSTLQGHALPDTAREATTAYTTPATAASTKAMNRWRR